MVDPIAVTAGLVQTALYLDFFYVYFTKYVLAPPFCYSPRVDVACLLGCCKDRSSSYLHKREYCHEKYHIPHRRISNCVSLEEIRFVARTFIYLFTLHSRARQ